LLDHRHGLELPQELIVRHIVSHSVV
jgi:hypothetical protein